MIQLSLHRCPVNNQNKMLHFLTALKQITANHCLSLKPLWTSVLNRVGVRVVGLENEWSTEFSPDQFVLTTLGGQCS